MCKTGFLFYSGANSAYLFLQFLYQSVFVVLFHPIKNVYTKVKYNQIYFTAIVKTYLNRVFQKCNPTSSFNNTIIFIDILLIDNQNESHMKKYTSTKH